MKLRRQPGGRSQLGSKPLGRVSLLLSVVLALLASACVDGSRVDFPSETTLEAESAEQGPAVAEDAACLTAGARASFAPDPSIFQSDAADIASIRQDGKLTVGVAQDTLLFGYLDVASGQIEGFDIEMARLVSQALFGSRDNVELVPIQSSERITKLQSGEVEMVVRTMTITCQRWAEVNFSSVYYEAGQRILVRSDSGAQTIEDLGLGAKVCAEAGTTSMTNLEGFVDIERVPVASIAECLVLFQQSAVDAISTDDTILAGLAAQDPFATVVGEFISEEPYGLAIKKENVEFTRYVNAVLERASEDGSWQAAYDRWLLETLGSQTQPAPAYR